MTDASITASAMVAELVSAARMGDAEAVNRICDIVAAAVEQPDRRVSTAFRLNPRGGLAPGRAGLFKIRDETLCALTELQPGERRSDRIQKARQKLARYAANGWPHEHDKPEETGNRERDLMRKIMRTGLPVPGERQHRAIMAERSRK